MKKLALVLVSAFFISSSSLERSTRQTQTLAFVNVSVIPMTEENLILENYTVTVNGGQISGIRPTESNDFEGGTFNTAIDGTGKFLMPGLAEMHGHIPPTHPSQNMPDYFDDKYVESTLFLYVAAGVTTVRGMLGYDRQLELKEKVGVAGGWELIGPRLFLAGPSFNGNTVSSPEQAEARVRAQHKEGWDLLKIHPGLTREEYDAIANTANELGIPFGGHVPQDVGIERAIAMGQQTIDHIDGYIAFLNSFEKAEQEQKMAEIVRATKENNAWIVPTMALWETILGAADYETMMNYDELKYIPKAVRENYHNWTQNNVLDNAELNLEAGKEEAALRIKLLGEMNRAGVKILMGTDAPQLYSVPGFSIHRELESMKEAGMSAYQILQSGTANVGEYLKSFGLNYNAGTIEKSHFTNLILLNDNPLENLENLKKLSGVLVNGRWYPQETIDKKLKSIEEYYSVD